MSSLRAASYSPHLDYVSQETVESSLGQSESIAVNALAERNCELISKGLDMDEERSRSPQDTDVRESNSTNHCADGRSKASSSSTELHQNNGLSYATKSSMFTR